MFLSDLLHKHCVVDEELIVTNSAEQSPLEVNCSLASVKILCKLWNLNI
jgi:hypothetical protein